MEETTTTTVNTYFEKYGSTHEKFFPEGKSGLTPLGPPPSPLTEEAWAERKMARMYQHLHLESLETHLLIESGAMEDQDPDILPSDLSTIHPLLDRENWETTLADHQAFHPLGHGRVDQFWTADNDEVWEALEPILALTTKFIDNSHIWPWWDALFFGKRHLITTHKASDGGDLHRFYQRPSRYSSSRLARENGRQFWLDLIPEVTFGMSSAGVDPRNGLDDAMGWDALTVPDFDAKGEGSHVRVYLPCEKVACLLFGNLTVGERLIVQFDTALALLHELAHVVHAFQNQSETEIYEPYFQDESVTELGHSLTNAIFGGRNFATIPVDRKLFSHLSETAPLALIFEMGYPTLKDTMRSSDPRLPCLDRRLSRGIGTYFEYTTPLKYLSDIQKEDFWDTHVTTYGLSVVWPLPLSLGTRWTRKRHKSAGSDGGGHSSGNGDDENEDNENQDNENEDNESQDSEGDVHTEFELLVDEGLESYEPYYRTLNLADANRVGMTKAHTTRERVRMAFDRINREYYAYDNDLFSKHYSDVSMRNSKAWNEWFDPNAPEPELFPNIMRILHADRYVLAFDTMVDWTPSNLLFTYINRLRPGAISKEQFYAFLECCQVHNRYLEYSRRSSGRVRVNPNGWPPANPPDEVRVPPARSQVAFQRLLVSYLPTTVYDERNGNLRDLDRDLFFERLTSCWTNLQRRRFDQGMAYMTQNKIEFSRAPPGVYRWAPTEPESAEETRGDNDGGSGGGGGGGDGGPEKPRKRGAEEELDKEKGNKRPKTEGGDGDGGSGGGGEEGPGKSGKRGAEDELAEDGRNKRPRTEGGGQAETGTGVAEIKQGEPQP